VDKKTFYIQKPFISPKTPCFRGAWQYYMLW